MVSRSIGLAATLLLNVACTNEPAGPADAGTVLHGFRLVDVSERRVLEQDVCIVAGRVCSAEQSAKSAAFARIEGGGRYLMPALWDLRAALWGNNSARNYEELYQEMSISQSLRVQLYYGVAHVGSFGMDSEWVLREIRRAEALDYGAAELLFPNRALCGRDDFGCVPVKRASEIPPLFQDRRAHGAPYVHLCYGDPGSKEVPSLSRELFIEALRLAPRYNLRAYVMTDDWAHVREAAELGAALVSALPDGPIPDNVIASLRDKAVAFAPSLSGFELQRVLGNLAALSDPFLTATASPAVLASFRDPKALWPRWSTELRTAQRSPELTLLNLRRMAEGGVHLVSVSDAGWTSGTFHGYSLHANQQWLERAGVEPWARLAAVTSWPAALVGREASFAPGASADFIALTADPRQSARNLRQISLLIREGKVVDRASLKPDLTRQRWQP